MPLVKPKQKKYKRSFFRGENEAKQTMKIKLLISDEIV